MRSEEDRLSDAGTLIIGYGSDLRGDDALGPTAARVIDRWKVDGVRVIVSHQLTPEMAASLAGADRVLFIDASVSSNKAPTIRPVRPRASADRIGHTGGPAELLALTRAVFGRCPSGWLLELPAKRFDIGARLSEEACSVLSEGVSLACDWIAGLARSAEELVPCMR